MFVDNNNKKSFGMGVTYALNDKNGIGYTNYIGDDTPEGLAGAHLRIHQNVFYNYAGTKIKVQVGGDYCMQQNSDLATSKNTATMYSALATIRYQATKRSAVYARGEIFSDPDGFMSTRFPDNSGKLTGYKLWGATVGYEFKPTEESYIRLESRLIQMDKNQYIFITDGSPQNQRMEIMVNGGVNFDLLRSVVTRKG
jgi:hypothetical protein